MRKNFLRNILFILIAILVLIQSIFVYAGTKNLIATTITSFCTLFIGASLIILCFGFEEKRPDLSKLNLTNKYKSCILRYNEENKLDILLRHYEYSAKLDNKQIIIRVSQDSKFITTISTTDYKWFCDNFVVLMNKKEF